MVAASTTQSVDVLLTEERQGRTSPGKITVQFWDSKDRTRRAFKFWGICWGGAMFAVILPLIHFVLVPSLLLAGPCVAVYLLTRESVVLGGQGTCPACQAALPIARTAYRFPISDVCSSCQSWVKISPSA